MDIYKLYRNFWDYAFENPEKIKPNHCAIFSFSVEHCNRLGWKDKFGLPTSMVMEATGIKSYSVFKKTFDELIEFGLIDIVQYSKNQYSSNIIALKENYKANDKATIKALDKATITHISKQSESTIESTGESIVSIDKQIYNTTNKPINQNDVIDLELNNIDEKTWLKWANYKSTQFKFKYKSKESEQTAINSLIKMSNNNNELALEIINQSISNGWSGLFELKNNTTQQQKEYKSQYPPLISKNEQRFNKFQESSDESTRILLEKYGKQDS